MNTHRSARLFGFLGIAVGVMTAPMGYSLAAGPHDGDVILTTSPADRTLALDVLRSDPTLRSVLRGRSFTVAETGPWTDATGTVLIGTAVRLQLDRPLTTQGSWPGVVHHGHSGRGYARGQHRLKVSEVTALDVLVDRTSLTVASIEPRPGSGTVVPLDDAAVTQPLPEAGETSR